VVSVTEEHLRLRTTLLAIALAGIALGDRDLRYIRGMSPSRSPRPLWMVVLAGLLFAGSALADERRERSEPRLILPGSHEVQAGQLVALEWTAADDVTELEILLSLDGGRTYPIWVSPRLSPRNCRFVWRVPPCGGRSLRMRIRFQRDGREIEGAPSASIAVAPAGAPQPLGLPPLGADPERVPRSGGESRSSRLDGGTCEAILHLTSPHHSSRGERCRAPKDAPPIGLSGGHRGPGFVPLRA
jgi:hypothetical protein